jgi:predicted nucleic acid-binding protein
VARAIGVEYEPTSAAAAVKAGAAFRSYRESGGSRERVVADFLIGAHALVQAERLLTRDRGFHRTYFKDVPILAPSAA